MFLPPDVTFRDIDSIPYRAMGPVTKEEFLSREEEYYIKQLKEEIGANPEEMSISEKMNVLRKFREENYEKLKNAVYERRGWDKNGIPTIKKIKELGMDYPEIIELIKENQ
jgi:aldehyde:ferredoxin oxidoreductase